MNQWHDDDAFPPPPRHMLADGLWLLIAMVSIPAAYVVTMLIATWVADRVVG